MKRVILAAVVGVLAIGSTACGEHPLYGKDLLRMELTPADPVMTTLGSSRQLTLSARDAAGREANPKLLFWESTNPEVATVDQHGRVTALREGVVGISVHAGNAGYAATRVYVDPRVTAAAWIAAVANRDLRPENDRDSTAVLVHEPGSAAQ